MYQVLRPSRSEYVPIRNLRYHVQLWGEPSLDRPPLVLLHGWMDVAASWQFVVDALDAQRFVIAPDWRGFGLTAGGGVDNYWMADYLADLEWLLDHYAGRDEEARPIDLVGHSMGGNIAMHYAGVRPKRVRRLVNIEGFGMPAVQAEEAPTRYGRWIDEIKHLHRGEMALARYTSIDGVVRRLMKTNPRLSHDKAEWLACRWAASQPYGADGSLRWQVLGEAAHKVINANIFRVDETLALYARITAPLLMVEASDDSLRTWWQDRFTLDEFHERLKSVSSVRIERLDDASHMLHHDRPERVAELIEEFLQD